MPVTDLITAVPGIVAFGLIPGFALATLCVPRWSWWARLAGSPGLAAGLAGVIGLVYHDAHIHFGVRTVAPVYVVLMAAAWLRWRATRLTPEASPGTPPHRATALIVGMALLAGTVSTLAVVVSFRDQPLPPATDSPVHSTVATLITRNGDTLPVVPVPADQSGYLRVRTGVEAVASLITTSGGPSETSSLFPLTLLSVLLLPLSLALLALETTRSVLLAAIAPLMAVALPFPGYPLVYGEFPLIVDSTLVVPLLVAALHVLRGVHIRDQLIMCAAVTAAIWVVHLTEALTVVVVGSGLLAVAAWRLDRLVAVRRTLAIVAACATGAVLVVAVTRHPAIPAEVISPLAGTRIANGDAFATVIGAHRAVDAVYTYTNFVFPNPAVLALGVFGVGAAIAGRRLRWAAFALAVMLLCFFDLQVTGVLRRLWVLLFPWSEDARLLSIQYWVLPLLMALAVTWLPAALTSMFVALRRSMTTPPWLAGRRVLVGAAVAVSVATLVSGAVRDGQRYSDASTLQVVTAADTKVMSAMSAQLRPGAVVLTDQVADAGQWIGALTEDKPFFSPYDAQEYQNDGRVVALENACSNPAAAHDVLRGVDAVFVGARLLPGPNHRWDVHCIQAVPGLRLIAMAQDGSGTAAAFAVTGSALSAR